ncbi:hypothetical protein FB451DRAFT_1439878 [Mycena latifolia]|nr:hypothetical protein FB451DRAFT_1439878 [Mycena latifolia]
MAPALEAASKLQPQPLLSQELLDTIISELEDGGSLKSCSVAGSLLRDTSQRILFQPVTSTSGITHNYEAAYNFLAGSPHIAGYIARVKIQMPDILHGTPADVESLQQVLAKLMNVRRCTLDGTTSLFRWKHLAPPLASSLLDFIARQPLRELHVNMIARIPKDTLLHLVAGASQSLSPARSQLVGPPGIQIEYGGVASSVYSAALPYGRRDYPLRSPYTRTSPSCLDIPSLSYPPLPPLPRLQTLELAVPFLHRDIPWFINTLTHVLAPTSYPVLTNLILILLMVLAAPRHLPTAQRLAALDAAHAAHPAAPRLRWLFRFLKQEGPAHIADLVDEVQKLIPTTYGMGRLVVKVYDEHRGT